MALVVDILPSNSDDMHFHEAWFQPQTALLETFLKQETFYTNRILTEGKTGENRAR